MSEQSYHQHLTLKNFTAFKEVELEFIPGVNVFVGENGTGKTHIMKVLYAVQLAQSRHLRIMFETLGSLFQVKELVELIRLGTVSDTWAILRGGYQNHEWAFDVRSDRDNWVDMSLNMKRPVFIPAIDMLGHTRGFLAAANEVVLDFDLTCMDIVSLLGLERRNGASAWWSEANMDAEDSNDTAQPLALENLKEQLGGSITYEESTGRFYLVTSRGRLPMPLVGEGLRKIATLVRLIQNGWIVPGTTLFWDEPEVNLNPKLMDEVIGAILSIARAGVQVFLATHSYVILKELDLQAKATDSVRYFGFQPNEDGTIVTSTDDFALLSPNPILDEYASLYDRELTRSTGRNSSFCFSSHQLL